MEIYFKDKKLRELCEDRSTAERKLGATCARKLRTRLSDLESASRVTDLVAGTPHQLKGNRQGQYSLRLTQGWRLVFTAAHYPNPTSSDGSIDWTQVTIVQIEYIGDYHD